MDGTEIIDVKLTSRQILLLRFTLPLLDKDIGEDLMKQELRVSEEMKKEWREMWEVFVDACPDDMDDYKFEEI